LWDFATPSGALEEGKLAAVATSKEPLFWVGSVELGGELRFEASILLGGVHLLVDVCCHLVGRFWRPSLKPR
jgi:hypothetical protein